MAAAFVQACQAGDNTSNTSLATAAFGSSTTTGNAIIVATSWDNPSATVTTVTDTAGNTYTGLTKFNSANNQTIQIFYALNITGGASQVVTMTMDNSRGGRRIVAHEVSGLAASGSFRLEAENQDTSAAPFTVTLTTSTDGEYVFSAVCNDGGTGTETYSPSGSFTEPANGTSNAASNEMQTQYLVKTTAGPVSSAWTRTGSGHNTYGIATFKAANTPATPSTDPARVGWFSTYLSAEMWFSSHGRIEAWFAKELVVQSGASGSGVGSSAGVGAASGVGASTAASQGASAGTGSATATGAAIFAGVGAASGTGSAAATAVAIFSGAGASAGIGTATAVGASTAASPGASSGIGTASGIGSSTAASPGSASGVGAATGIGSSTAAAVGAASGTGTATAIGDVAGSTTSGDGAASGQGTATATGASTASSIGASSGLGSGIAAGSSTAAASGSASGTGSATATGDALSSSSGVGSASGTGTATGAGASTAEAVGSATGIGSASAEGLGVSDSPVIQGGGNSGSPAYQDIDGTWWRSPKKGPKPKTSRSTRGQEGQSEAPAVTAPKAGFPLADNAAPPPPFVPDNPVARMFADARHAAALADINRDQASIVATRAEQQRRAAIIAEEEMIIALLVI
jgi:hypothetical protein